MGQVLMNKSKNVRDRREHELIVELLIPEGWGGRQQLRTIYTRNIHQKNRSGMTFFIKFPSPKIQLLRMTFKLVKRFTHLKPCDFGWHLFFVSCEANHLVHLRDILRSIYSFLIEIQPKQLIIKLFFHCLSLYIQ